MITFPALANRNLDLARSEAWHSQARQAPNGEMRYLQVEITMTKSSTPNLSRRTIAKAGAAAAAGLATSRIAAPPAGARQGGEVTFMHWDTVSGTPLETALQAFEEESGITVNVQPTPAQDYETKMRTLLASGSPPDVMCINDNVVRDYAVAGQLLDLNQFIEDSDRYIESLFNFPVTPEGTHPAWTIGTDPRVIYYNVDMFEAEGVPLPPTTWTDENRTWDYFVETAKQLTDADAQQWGALLYHDKAAEQTWAVNNGVVTGTYSEDDTEFTLANSKASRRFSGSPTSPASMKFSRHGHSCNRTRPRISFSSAGGSV